MRSRARGCGQGWRRTLGRGVSVGILLLGLVVTGFAVPGDGGPLHAQQQSRTGLYVPPVNAYILDPLESPITLTFGTASIATIQAQLDAARAGNADAPIVLTLTGTYTVTDAPLTLPSKTSLVLYGTIKAGRHVTATSLIAVTGQTKVGIAGGYLDGRGEDLIGIAVDASSKINVDDVTVANTGLDGIVLSGNGNDAWDQGSAITRCDVARAHSNGITIRAITQALVFDNLVHHNGGAGIQVSGTHNAIVNNTSRGNGVGIAADAADNVIADNMLYRNRDAGLRLTSTSASSAVLRNTVRGNRQTGIDLDGANHLVYANVLANETDLTEHAGTGVNWVVPRREPLAAPASQYFYPPTADNPHADPIVNGRGRFDLTIASTSIADVQQAYDAARLQHPDEIIVLHLTGEFLLDAAPLVLTSNTSVLLDGAIRVTSTTAPQAIAATNPTSFISLSGGTIDCGGRVMEGIFMPSSTMAVIDGVTVTHCGEQLPRSVSNSIHFQRGSGYNILRGNRVDISGGRCIWTQQSSARYIVLDNYTSHCNQDGVDFDSSTSNSVASGNVSEDNLRYGVFIEQSDALNTVYGNFATTRGLGSGGRGVGVYNNATASAVRNVTDKNTVFSNINDVIANGLRLGSIATAAGGRAETAHTFFFNNIVTNTTTDGILVDTQFERSVQNYFSQTVLIGNRADLTSRPSNGGSPADFFNPMSAIDFALKRPVIASSTAPGFDPASAVDGLAFTQWIAGRERRPSLTIDLGADFTIRRVAIKPTATARRARHDIHLLTSADGVTFTRLYGADIHPTSERVVQITFPPVTARFLRVQIEGHGHEHAGLTEVSVHPQ